jgi:hypothetical protein
VRVSPWLGRFVAFTLAGSLVAACGSSAGSTASPAQGGAPTDVPSASSSPPPTPAPTASPGLVVRSIADLIGSSPVETTRDDLLSIDPGAKKPDFNSSSLALALNLCAVERPDTKQPASETSVARQAFCLGAIAALWSTYRDMTTNSYSGQASLDQAFAAAASAYSFAVDTVGPDAKAYFDKALTAAFGAGSPAAAASPTGLRPISKLLGKPHQRPSTMALAKAYRAAIAAGAARFTPEYVPIGGTFSGASFINALAGCSRSHGGGINGIGEQLGNCQSLAIDMWRAYRVTGTDEYWKAAKAAFEMGYSVADPNCSGWICRNEYLAFFSNRE